MIFDVRAVREAAAQTFALVPSSLSFMPDPIFDAWHTYEKVVAANYMFHREIGAGIRRLLQSRFEGRPFSFFDLGCGDAATLAPILDDLALQSYKGVDLSETALSLAEKNLAFLSCPVELVHGDILSKLTEDTTSYDVIYCSFALHHLPTDKKAEFFNQIGPHLSAAGLFVLVDTVREENESLQAYYRHYCDWLHKGWGSLNAEEFDLVCDHIVKNDLPEPLTVLRAQSRAAGLGQPWEVGRYDWHHVLCFPRA
ncbi:MAG: class I SAM-dependent methyltransferase [Alphaproteobacteria bacterium]|nr:class I SAM-dependent methyltransferase [Alphaproteobacteria bacterium]